MIPWLPMVESAKCKGCRVCFEFCRRGVYEWDVLASRPVVARPLNCLVGCSGCEPKCPAGAIGFPDVDGISELIRRLRQELWAGGSAGGEPGS